MRFTRNITAVFRPLSFLLVSSVCSWEALGSVTQRESAEPTRGAAQFRDALTNYVDQSIAQSTPGYALGVIVDGDIFMLNTGGVRKRGAPNTVNADTVFRLASVSKTFASGLAASLSSVNMADKLSEYLPDVSLSRADYQQELSLGHLLSHTSGLMPHAYTNLIQDNQPYKKIIGKLERVNFICAPGECYGYQNVVYSLAGDLIAAREGTSYESLVQKQLFDPAGMRNSSFGLQAFMSAENRATPHRWDRSNKLWDPVKVRGNYYRFAPAAGVNASLNDMMGWLRVQLGLRPDVIDSEALKDLHEPRVRTSRKRAHYQNPAWNGVANTQYALGWRTFDFKGQEGFVHHGGWVKGVRTELVFNKRLQMGLVYLSNSEASFASEIVPSVLNLYLSKF